MRSPTGTDSFPVGNNGAPANRIPPGPPIEERGRDEKGEGKGEGGERPRDPIADQCIEIATRRWGDKNGDSVVGDLLRDYDPAWVRIAIDKEWDKHRHDLRPAYLRSILQGFQKEGGPPKGRDSPPTAAPVERKYVTATEEHIHPKFRKQA
jgi:hypothetical protein